jgi:hypothetical protein
MNHRRQHWLDAMAETLRARGVHPARAVLLLPCAQLTPVAARLWAQRHPAGFAPRVETRQNGAQSLAGQSDHGPRRVCNCPARMAWTCASNPGQTGVGGLPPALRAGWVVNSSYGSDAFFPSEVRVSAGCLLVLFGLQLGLLIEGCGKSGVRTWRCWTCSKR